MYFFSKAKLALDMLELSPQEIIRLISELRMTGSYEYVILDLSFDLGSDTLSILHQVHAVVLVGDGSQVSNTKLSRACAALAEREKNDDAPILSKAVLAYNKFSSKTGKSLDGLELRSIGGAQRYEGSLSQIIDQLSQKAIFDNIIQ